MSPVTSLSTVFVDCLFIESILEVALYTVQRPLLANQHVLVRRFACGPLKASCH
jgi:hypothetical protein